MINPWQRPLPDSTQHTQQKNIHAPGGIRNHNPSRRAAEDLRLRKRGYWDQCLYLLPKLKIYIKIHTKIAPTCFGLTAILREHIIIIIIIIIIYIKIHTKIAPIYFGLTTILREHIIDLIDYIDHSYCHNH